MTAIKYLGGLLLATAATITTASLAIAQPPHHTDAAPRETVTPAFSNPISNIPGKSLMAVVVSYPPGGKTPPHMHAKSAFITGYVLSGAIRSKVDNDSERVFKAGESWTEKPGAHHGMSENASALEPASLLAIFVVDNNEKKLTTFVGK
jgi:quercetin dioxygenase-like cupin family protein